LQSSLGEFAYTTRNYNQSINQSILMSPAKAASPVGLWDIDNKL